MLKSIDYLRIYPGKFGDAIVHLREDLVNSRVDHDWPSPTPAGVDTLMATPPDDGLFRSADLLAVFRYLRGGKRLNLPKHWKEIIPGP